LDAELFQWALKARPGKIVYFSSAAAYPIEMDRPVVESDIDLDNLRQPDRIYGLTKLVGEIQAREAVKAGLDVLVVRPQSGYGADQSLSYPFPTFIERAKNREDPFVVWGSGKQSRDFVHVDDIVGAVMAFLAADFQGPVNIGTGHSTSLYDLALAVCLEASYFPEIRTRRDKPECAPYHCADTTLMRTYYEAKISLQDGIREALA
jgi:nucleoside-diphosphate-sugar epimerase